MEWERIQKWNYIVDSVAYEYHKRFHMVEIADLRQTLYQWFAEHPNKLDEWEAIGDKDAKNLLYRSLRNQALDYCQRWKAKSIGYDVTDNFYYDIDLVANLLPSVLRGEFNRSHKTDLGLPHGTQAPNEGGNGVVMMIEIDYGFWKLPKDERNLLILRYGDAMELVDMANALGTTEDAMRMKINRILKKLVRNIGGFKPFNDTDFELKSEEELDLT